MTGAGATPDELVAEAERILDGEKYRPRGESLAERVLGWLGDRLADVLEALAGDGVASVLLWVVLVALAAAVVWLLSRLGGGEWRRPARRRAEVAVSAVPAPPGGAEWRRRAEAAEAAGDLDGAVRCHWRALVADMAGEGIVDERPAATSGDYRRDAAAHDAGASQRFERATSVFEEVWFGGVDAEPSTVDLVRGRDLP